MSLSHNLQAYKDYQSAKLLHFESSHSLEEYKAQQLSSQLNWVAKHSPFYQDYAGKPFDAWPVITHAEWQSHFDKINTANLTLERVTATAVKAEKASGKNGTTDQFTIELSPGTEGNRNVSVLNSTETAQRTGLALAHLLPGSLFGGERVALFLRSSSNPYPNLRTPWLSFKLFELTSAFEVHLAQLSKFRPTIIVAPAQLLRALALAQQRGDITLPKSVRLVSEAEVLDAGDTALITRELSKPTQTYAAIEGRISYTCARGHLHLNEEFFHIEPQWLPNSQVLMTPIITDLTRRTQPLIRYKLDDVLAVRKGLCSCGNPTMVLDRIDGRASDLIELPGTLGPAVIVFSDTLSRLLLMVLPLDMDYSLRQVGASQLELTAPLLEAKGIAVLEHLRTLLTTLGVNGSLLQMNHIPGQPAFEPGTKRRRISRAA